MNCTEIARTDRPKVCVDVQTVVAAGDAHTALVNLVANVPVMMLTVKVPPIHRKEVPDPIKANLDLKSLLLCRSLDFLSQMYWNFRTSTNIFQKRPVEAHSWVF
jgi:hypothetical protein